MACGSLCSLESRWNATRHTADRAVQRRSFTKTFFFIQLPRSLRLLLALFVFRGDRQRDRRGGGLVRLAACAARTSAAIRACNASRCSRRASRSTSACCSCERGEKRDEYEQRATARKDGRAIAMPQRSCRLNHYLITAALA